MSLAQAQYSIAQAQYSIAQAQYSIAQAQYSIAQAQYSIAQAQYSIAQAQYSRLVQRPPCLATVLCSSEYAIAWAATFAFTPSRSAIVACSCASSVHTSIESKPIGGAAAPDQLPQSTALRLWHRVFSRRVTQCPSDSAAFFSVQNV